MSVSVNYPLGYQAYRRDAIIRAAIDKRLAACDNRAEAKMLKGDLIARVQDRIYLGWRMPTENQDPNLTQHWLAFLEVGPEEIGLEPLLTSDE